MSPSNQPFQVAGDGMDDGALLASDPTFTSGIALLSDASLDAIWAELDGDLVPEGGADDLGPFTVDDAGTSLWIEYTEININVDVTVIEISGGDLAALLPSEVDTGWSDPFALPAQDWCTCGAYDPMDAATDWTMDGYVTFDDPFALPGSDAMYADAGAFYDSWDPGAGYWDTSSYYDTTGSFLDAPDSYGGWDDISTLYGSPGDFGGGDFGGTSDFGGTAFGAAPFGGGSYGTGAFDSYDATSGWDPTAGDAAHEQFLSAITEDYSSSYADPSDWSSSDSSQFWMDEYNAADDLSWDAWNNSVDAYLAGDDMAAYDWNQQSLDWGSYADDAWSYSSDYSTDYSSDYSTDYSSDYSSYGDY